MCLLLSRSLSDDHGHYEACWVLAELLRAQGYVAIISPSATLAGEKNINIYIDGLAGNTRLRDGGDRFTLELTLPIQKT